MASIEEARTVMGGALRPSAFNWHRSWSGSRWLRVAGQVLLPCLILQATPFSMMCWFVTTSLAATATPPPVTTTVPLSSRASTMNTEGDKRLKSSCGEAAVAVWLAAGAGGGGDCDQHDDADPSSKMNSRAFEPFSDLISSHPF